MSPNYRRAIRLILHAMLIASLGTVINSFNHIAVAQPRSASYKPIPLTPGQVVNDVLTDKDIPTGQKGFARDYELEVKAEDRLEISATSDAFDTVVSFLGKDGDVIAENDDGEGEGSNSLLFVKVKKTGVYTIRVQSFGGSSGGKFTLRVTKLRPVE